ncbi:putative GEM-like protein 8 [Triticum urartu]|uniref:GRAM domain-containing protein n=1 Tax=Triticum urartu TaxID=4572 RepID=A0A8R7QU55_TRIUA|nr:putative GEM-like protein 8 [Triticum urartu]
MEGSTSQDHVIGIPVNSTAYGIEEPDFVEVEEAITPPDHGGFVSGSFQSINNNDGDSNGSTATDRDQTSQVRRKRGKIAQGIKEHVTLGPKLSETVKGKLTLGARILQAGGVEKVFRQWFSVDKNERLVRASQCYLSTTAGPIAGMLFVSTERVAFRSDRSLAVAAPDGAKLRVPYKVTIPLRKVRRAVPTENKHKPEQRYIEVVTNDGFEFWFMGFVSYHRSLQHLEQAIAQARR